DTDFTRPVLGDDAEAGQQHQQNERDDDSERYHRDAVGLQAPPRQRPQAGGYGVRNFAPPRQLRLDRGLVHRRLAHFNWTRGSTALYMRSAARLASIVAMATYT